MSQTVFAGNVPSGRPIDTLTKCLQAFREIERAGGVPVVTEGNSMSPMLESDHLIQMSAVGVQPDEIKCGEVYAVFLPANKTVIKVLDSYARTILNGAPAVILSLRGINREVSQDYLVPLFYSEFSSRVYPVLLSPNCPISHTVLVELSNYVEVESEDTTNE